MACGFEPHHRHPETCVTAQVFLYVPEDIRMICRIRFRMISDDPLREDRKTIGAWLYGADTGG